MRTISDFRSIEIFAAVVEAGSLTGAAARLGISKSLASTQLGRLERDLGLRLVHRTTRRIALTEAGDAFYRRCRTILDDIEDAERSVTRFQAEPRGTLRLGAPMTFGTRFLGDAAADFLVRHPGVDIDMTLTDRRVDLIEEGLDLVVRIGDLADSSLVARKLGETRMLLVASLDYLERRGRPKTPRDLARHDVLVYSYAADGDRWRLEGRRGRVSVAVAGRVRANNGEVLLAAARRGLGIARVPDFLCADALRDGSLEAVCADWVASRSGIWAVHPPARFVSAKVRLFIDFLVERFSATPPAGDTPRITGP